MRQTRRQSTATKRRSKRHRLLRKNLDTKNSSERSTSTHLRISPRLSSSLTTHTALIARDHTVRLRRVSLPLPAVISRRHAARSATAPAAAVPRRRSSKNARQLWKRSVQRHHLRRLHHRKPRNSLRNTRLSSKSARRRHPTAVRSSTRSANSAASVTSNTRFAHLSLSDAPYAWSVRTRTGWHCAFATDLRTISWWNTATVATVRSCPSSKETLARRGTSSVWRRTEKVGWPWFGLLIDSTSTGWVVPCWDPCCLHAVRYGTLADHTSATAKRKEKQAKKVALAIATLT